MNQTSAGTLGSLMTCENRNAWSLLSLNFLIRMMKMRFTPNMQEAIGRSNNEAFKITVLMQVQILTSDIKGCMTTIKRIDILMLLQ